MALQGSWARRGTLIHQWPLLLYMDPAPARKEEHIPRVLIWCLPGLLALRTGQGAPAWWHHILSPQWCQPVPGALATSPARAQGAAVASLRSGSHQPWDQQLHPKIQPEPNTTSPDPPLHGPGPTSHSRPGAPLSSAGGNTFFLSVELHGAGGGSRKKNLCPGRLFTSCCQWGQPDSLHVPTCTPSSAPALSASSLSPSYSHPHPHLILSCPYPHPIPILIPPPKHLSSHLVSSPPLPYPHPCPRFDLISHPSSHPHPFFTPTPLLNANLLPTHQDCRPPLREGGSQILPWGYHSPPNEHQS